MKAPTPKRPPRPFPSDVEEAKIVLGHSFGSTVDTQDVNDYLYMRWGSGTSTFKPKSAYEEQTGTMHLLNNAGDVLLKFPNNAFEGKIGAISDDKVDCILFWDEKSQCLVLENVTSQISKLQTSTRDLSEFIEPPKTVPTGKFATKTAAKTATKTASKTATKTATKSSTVSGSRNALAEKRPTQRSVFAASDSEESDSDSSDDSDSEESSGDD